MIFFDELKKFSFAHYHIGDVEAGKFNLLGSVEVELV